MEKFSQFRDRGLRIKIVKSRSWINVFRIRDSSVPPDSVAARGLPAATAPVPVLLSPAVVGVSVCWLLCDSAMAADRVVGEEGVAVVYSGSSEYLVD